VGVTGEGCLPRSKSSEQQIAFILRQAEEGTAVEEVCRKAGVSIQPYYNGGRSMAG
jgi:putative transposase